jgi:hypothetical protein
MATTDGFSLLDRGMSIQLTISSGHGALSGSVYLRAGLIAGLAENVGNDSDYYVSRARAKNVPAEATAAPNPVDSD